MAANPYTSLDDVRAIITDEMPEGVSLEYKRSAIITERDVNALCKTVTALANSAGGQFILGIESHAGKPVRLDGGVPGPSRRDWIHKVINASTFPAVESVDVFELSDPTGSYYAIDVPASHQAPHQSNDRRYYKRRGSHSEPMEHYEIEDIRNRPKRPLAPLRMALFTEGHLAYIHFRNEHASDAVKDIQCEFAPNFPLDQNR
jgi:hypothetical protein